MITKSRLLLALAFAGISCPSYGISWHAYYQAHKKEVDAEIATGRLDLSHKHLDDLAGFDPVGVTNLDTIHALILDHNNIEQLPYTIGSLTNLKLLKAQHNKINFIAAEIGELKELKLLDLANNRITKLPSSVANLTSLIDLWVGYNSLTSVPAAIDGMTSLELLDLSHNELTVLPATITKLPNLKILSLADNDLTRLPALGELPHLAELNVENNPLALTADQLRKELEIGEGVDFKFRTPEQEEEIQLLFKGIKGADEGMVQEALNELNNEESPNWLMLDKIRDHEGHNILLHLLIASDTAIDTLTDQIRTLLAPHLEPGSVEEKNREAAIQELLNKINVLNVTYWAILTHIQGCGPDCVGIMLLDTIHSKTWSQLLNATARKDTINTLYGVVPKNRLYNELLPLFKSTKEHLRAG